MILVRKIESFKEIEELEDCFAIQSIYELVQNDEDERIFRPCPVSKPSFWKVLFDPKLENHYYINKNRISIMLEKEIRHRDAGRVALTLNLTVRLDIEGSDSGKDLADWLAEHNGRMDKESLKTYLQAKLTPGFLEESLGLNGKSSSELRGGRLSFGPETFRDALSHAHWIFVDCQVVGAVEKQTQTQINREIEAKRLAEEAKRLAEAERCHQEELALLDRKKEELVAVIEIQKLENELAKLKAEQDNLESQRQADLLETVRNTLDSEKTRGFPQIEGTPWPTERIMLELNGVRLELYAMKKATLGRVTPNSDVVVKIPQGCPDEEKRREQSEKPTISRTHAKLEWRGDSVLVQNVSTIVMTYVNGKEVPEKGTVVTGDVELGFSWNVRWQARVQKCTGRLHLPCCDGCAAHGVSSMVLAYPGWTQLYKAFVWQCCMLRQVDSRMPDWRVVYQYGAQGSEGAFYLLTNQGRCMYLQPDREIVEDGVAMCVKSM